MKRIICFFSTTAIAITICAQNKLPEFSKIELADIRLKSCSFEPEANAMKLFDVQEIEFGPGEYTSKLKHYCAGTRYQFLFYKVRFFRFYKYSFESNIYNQPVHFS